MPKYTAHYPDLDQPVWFRVRFYSHHADPRPVGWPPPGPWWCSGETEDGKGNTVQVIIAYTKEPDKLKEQWPEIGEISFTQGPEVVQFFDRFPKPDWIVDSPVGT